MVEFHDILFGLALPEGLIRSVAPAIAFVTISIGGFYTWVMLTLSAYESTG